MTAIKICGIKTPEMAEFCATAGADYIGLICCENSVRYVPLTTAKAIASTALEFGIIPVAVFTTANAEEIMKTCDITGITYVQLHGEAAKHALTELPQHLHKIYVTSIIDDPLIRPPGTFSLWEKEETCSFSHKEMDLPILSANLLPQSEIDSSLLPPGKGARRAEEGVSHDILSNLRKNEDFLLFDSEIAGSGQTINWSTLTMPANYRCFLAGGLTPDNVIQAIKTTNPYGVDVSSGVESTRGVKSRTLIQQFITNVAKG